MREAFLSVKLTFEAIEAVNMATEYFCVKKKKSLLQMKM